MENLHVHGYKHHPDEHNGWSLPMCIEITGGVTTAQQCLERVCKNFLPVI